MKLMSGNANRPLAEAVADHMDAPLTKAQVRRFSDNEIFVTIDENVRGEDVFVIQSTSYPANDHLMELLICLDALRRAHGAAAMARIQRAIDMHTGRIAQEWPHPQQRPAFLLLPGLEPRPWFEREEFPYLDSIERETDAIRAEMLAVLTERTDLKPYVDMPHDAPAARVWGDLIDNPRWSAYHFHRHGERIDAHHARCPRTSAALAALPLMHIPGHAPEAMFSVLSPRTRIPPHTGSINGRLICHLPLVVPPNCGALACADQPRPWVEGRCFVFDDSIKHEAWNDSDQTRVVLIFDLWNPQLTPADEKKLMEAMQKKAADD